ncbi:hypothetical protein [Catenisphaera adipataccumulans]|uniref:Streptococcal pilin isopeptide linker domain-containing protein n=1 Tax=Catenisphaera adipataccumulans TaxID=700500 RepID=A0A7W8D0B2_9FIRM|nr:hypothetical protein [Catenisphaera adipataccumulans]MBB5183230.1 hypothetical protein [Catenisphaera adipataccumulans]
MRKLLSILLSGVMALLFCIVPVQAQERQETSSVTIRQTIEINGNYPEQLDRTVKYILTAENNAPLPNTLSTISITGSDSALLTFSVNEEAENAVILTEPQDDPYIYTITAQSVDDENFSIDTKSYQIEVLVQQTPDGQRYLQVVCIDLTTGKKVDTISFTHTYEGVVPEEKEETDPPKKNENTPTSYVQQIKKDVKTGQAYYLTLFVMVFLFSAAALWIMPKTSRKKNH